MSLPNTFHSSKWKINFSNIPTITNYHDMRYYDWYVKSLSIPSYSLQLIESKFNGSTVRHPISQQNDNLDSFNIDFKCSENLTNYYNLLEFMQRIRYGQENTEDKIRDNVVKKITVELLDNQRRTISRIFFKNSFLVSLGGLNLNMGQDEEVTFSTTWLYDEIVYDNSL